MDIEDKRRLGQEAVKRYWESRGIRNAKIEPPVTHVRMPGGERYVVVLRTTAPERSGWYHHRLLAAYPVNKVLSLGHEVTSPCDRQRLIEVLGRVRERSVDRFQNR